MAEQTPAPVAAAPAGPEATENANANAAAAAAPAAHVPEAEAAPPAKRARVEEASGDPMVTDAPAPSADGSNPIQTLEALAGLLPAEKQKELYDMMSKVTGELVDTRRTNAQQLEELATLRKAQVEQEDKEQKNARKLASVMDQLLQAYGAPEATPRSDTELDAIAKSIRDAPHMLEFLQPITVAASNITSRMKRAHEEQRDLEESKNRFKSLSDQYKNMGSLWEPSPAPAPAPAPAPVAAPTPVIPQMAAAPQPVAVAASALTATAPAPAARTVPLPDFLRQNLTPYDANSTRSDRVLPSHFEKPIAGYRSQNA